MKRRFRRDFRAVADQRGRAMPADLDAPEQIGLRTRHLEHARGIEARLGAENLRIGQKTHLGAAAVQRLADDRKLAGRLAPFERLPIKRLAAGDLDLEFLGQRVHHRDADAVEPAGGLVGAAVEFAARVQHRHDHFEGGLFGKFRVRVDRHAAAVVDHGQIPAVLERDLDECGVAGDGFVHRIVDDFGKEMMQRVGVCPAHVHSGAPTYGLQPLEHFDRGGRVVRFVGRSVAHARLGVDWRGFAASRRCRAEKIIHVSCHILANRRGSTYHGEERTKRERSSAARRVWRRETSRACSKAVVKRRARQCVEA